MKIISKTSDVYVVRFDRGEKWPEVLFAFCKKAKLKTSIFFFGLGGFKDPTVAFYNVSTKRYTNKKFAGQYEVLSLIGNSAELDGEPVVHAHVGLGNEKYQGLGGHLVSATIGGTLELYVHRLGSTMKRKKDPATGLNLLE